MSMQSEQQQRIMGYFIEEAKDHLNTIESGLLNLQSTIGDAEMVSEVFRAAHSVKGGAAMLGLGSIQRTAHRLEDYFKVLKECPVTVDQKLETLFLRVFDTLQELIDQLQGPFGLTDDKSDEIMSDVEPVFASLNEHLNHLVSQGGGTPPEEVDLLSHTAAAPPHPAPAPVAAPPEEESALLLIFQSDVPGHLRAMLQLFKQADQAETRQQLQDLCRVMAQAGEQFDLTAWCGLVDRVKQAIAHSDNTFKTLAPVVIKELKQAQSMVLAGQSAQIACSEALAALVPAPLSELDFALDETAEIDADLDSLFAGADDESVTAADFDFLNDTPGLSADDELLMLNDLPDLSSEAEGETDDWFTVEADAAAGSGLELAMDEPSDRPMATGDGLDLIDALDENPEDALRATEQAGPEVGPAELNTLADLFEGESLDLGMGWQEEEVIAGDALSLMDTLEPEPSNDFSDLLFDQEGAAPSQVASEDNLAASFDDLMEISAAPTPAPTQDLDLDSLDPFQDAGSLDEALPLDASMDDIFGTGGEAIAALEEPTPASDDLDFGSALDDLFDLADQQNDADAADLPPPALDGAMGDIDALFGQSDAEGDRPLPDFAWGDEADLSTDGFLAELTDEELLADLDADLGTDLADEVASPFADATSDLGMADLELDGFGMDEGTIGTPSAETSGFPDATATDGELGAGEMGDLDLDAWMGDRDTVSPEVLGAGDGSEDAALPDALEALTMEDVADASVAEADGLDLDDLFGNGGLEIDALLDNAPVALGGDEDNPVDDALDLSALMEDEAIAPDLDYPDLGYPSDDEDAVEAADLGEFAMEDALGDDHSTAVDAMDLGMDLDLDLGIDLETDFAETDLNALDAAPELDTELSPEADLNALDDLLATEPSPFVNDLFGQGESTAATESALQDAENFDVAALELDLGDDVLGNGLGDPATESFQGISDEDVLFDLDGMFGDEASEGAEGAMAVDDGFADDGLDDFADLGNLLEGLSDSELGDRSPQPPLSEESLEELDALDSLLEPDFAENGGAIAADDFMDLAQLLDDQPSAEVSPALDMAMSDDFADLDALLDDAPAPATDAAGEDFADLEALLDEDGPATPENDFSDLDALLEDEPVRPSIPVPKASAPAANDDFGEFDDLEKLLEDADNTLGGPPTSKGVRRAAPTTPNRRNVRRGHSDQTMRVSVKNLDNLNNLIGELVVNRNSLEQTQERLRQFLDNLLYQVQQLSDVGQRMRDLYERSLLESSLLSSRKSPFASPSHGATDGQTHATGASFDALEMDRFTGFHTLSQEMIELIVRVRESASDIDFVVDESDQITRTFRQVTTQLQEGLTRSRMVPFAQTADRLPRAVRDISLKCGKQAELVVEGRDTLIDKMILESLYDPMTHLVNNAITHGIETPEERMAAGKAPTGRITIRTFHQGNQTVISISDDGAGIDAERVKAKAIEKGLVTPQEAREMTRLDVYDLLFHSGFSTRDKADDFAGRGVGMDVVRTNLTEIRGAINTDSALGKGTTFTIRLPLTLSISKALCCISNRARIAFPMDGVEDMLDVPRDRIQTDEEGRSCITWREMLLPFQPLSELLSHNRSLGRGSVYGGNQEDEMISVIVLRSAGNFLALQVDQVLGEQEIVIKQLEGPVPKPVGIAGATVLGDGRIMPIADVLELIDLSMGRIRRDSGSSLWTKDDGAAVTEAPPAKSEPTVLIVDDSITVRELLSMTFNKVGYRVEQARDGQEAWEKLRSGLPCDLVFCDIEMPRMDGLELLSRIQKDPNLVDLPIAMLTSRGADRHRQMAITLGAKGYFTKPYLEEALLDAAQRMLKGEVLVGAAG